MDKLPRIPSPPGTLFREFRIRALPILAFSSVLAMTVMTWRSYVAPSNLVGEVEAVRRLVMTAQPGRITKLHVTHLQRVSKGDPLLEVEATDPRLLEARLALTRARLSFVKEAVDARVRQENNRTSMLQLKLDWLDQRALLASLKAQEGYFRQELLRQERLLGGNVTNRVASEMAIDPEFSSTPGPQTVDRGAPGLEQADIFQSKAVSNVRPGTVVFRNVAQPADGQAATGETTGDTSARVSSQFPINPNFNSTPGPQSVDRGEPRLDQSANARSENFLNPRLQSSLRPDYGLSLGGYSLRLFNPSRLNSIAEYDVAVRDFQAVAGEIEERTRLVKEIGTSMESLGVSLEQLDREVPEALRRIVEVEEQELRFMETQLSPTLLTAPMDGVVSVIYRREGENVTEGEPLLQLSALSSDRIVAFVRQPLNVEPSTNMVVEVRSRSLNREVGQGRVLAVGTQLEPILPQLLPGGSSNALEYGLPILVSVPPGMRLVPGEAVDLIARQD